MKLRPGAAGPCLPAALALLLLLLPGLAAAADPPMPGRSGAEPGAEPAPAEPDHKSDLLLFEAETWLRQGNFAEAARVLGELLERNPHDLDAMERLAETYRAWSLSDPKSPDTLVQASLDLYRRMLEEDPRHREALDGVRVLALRFRADDPKAATSAPDPAAAAADTTGLRAAWTAAWVRNPADESALLGLSALEERAGNERRAETLLRIAFELSDTSAVVRDRLRELTTRLAAVAPEPERTFYLGRLDLAEEKPIDAAPRLRQAVEADTTIFDFRKYYGIALFRGGRIAEALDWLQPLQADDPTDPDIRLCLGTLLFELRHYEAALEQLVPLAEEHRFRGEAARMVGIALSRSGDHDEPALYYLEMADREGSTDPGLPCLLGEHYVRMRRWDEARTSFERCARQSPDHPAASLGLGLVADQAKDWRGSIAHFEKFLAAEPQSPAVLMRVGVAYLRLDEPDSAVARFRASIAADSAFARLPADSLGAVEVCEVAFLVLMASREYGDGIVVGEHLLARQPENPGYANNLAMACADGNLELDRALELARKANEWTPDNAGFMDTLGWVLVRMKKFKEAEKALDRSLELATAQGEDDVSEIHYHRAVLYADSRRREMAIAELQKALETPGNVMVRRNARALLEYLMEARAAEPKSD